MEPLNKLREGLAKAETKFDIFRHKVKKKYDLIGPVEVEPYTGFASNGKIWLKGRVVEESSFSGLPESKWDNLKKLFARYETDEVPNVDVYACINGQEFQAKSGEEGFFEIEAEGVNLPDEDWVDVDLRIQSRELKASKPVFNGKLMNIRSKKARFGIISDVDDTILISRSHSFFKELEIKIMNNAKSHSPFEGVAELFNKFRKGKEGSDFNPIFYLSGTSWNLYDLLYNFLQHHNIPQGVFLLQSRGLTEDHFYRRSVDEYKKDYIRFVLDALPDLNFVLIGDSGQKDPEIYLDIVKENPGRLKCIIIRDVKEKKQGRMKEIAEECWRYGVKMDLVKSSEEAEECAREAGILKDQ